MGRRARDRVGAAAHAPEHDHRDVLLTEPADPYGYAAPYYAAGWQPPRARTEPLAIWSLVTGILLLGPVTLVLAIVALRRIATRYTRGRGMAIAGAVLGAVGTLAIIGAATVAVLTAIGNRPLPADVSSPRSAHAQQLVTGNCIETLPADGLVDTVRVVPCADAHAAQVITVYEFAADAVWPGQQAADARVARSCVLDQAELDAGVRTVTWSPTERSWARGDRRGLCLTVADGGGATGPGLSGVAPPP